MDAGRRPRTEEGARRVGNAAAKWCAVVGSAAKRKRRKGTRRKRLLLGRPLHVATGWLPAFFSFSGFRGGVNRRYAITII